MKQANLDKHQIAELPNYIYKCPYKDVYLKATFYKGHLDEICISRHQQDWIVISDEEWDAFMLGVAKHQAYAGGEKIEGNVAEVLDAITRRYSK